MFSYPLCSCHGRRGEEVKLANADGFPRRLVKAKKRKKEQGLQQGTEAKTSLEGF